MHAVIVFVDAVRIWLAVGLVFGLAFAFGGGIARVDPAARDAGVPVRLMLLPGLAVLWPVMALRWVRARSTGRRDAEAAAAADAPGAAGTGADYENPVPGDTADAKRAHRSAHRLIWWLLGPAALLLLWLAIDGRPADPLAPRDGSAAARGGSPAAGATPGSTPDALPTTDDGR